MPYAREPRLQYAGVLLLDPVRQNWKRWVSNMFSVKTLGCCLLLPVQHLLVSAAVWRVAGGVTHGELNSGVCAQQPGSAAW